MNRESREQIAHVVSQIETEVEALAVTNAQTLRGLRRRFSKLIARHNPEVVVGIGISLVGTPGFAYRFMAYEMLLNHKAAFASLGSREVSRLARGLDTWGAVDTFACYVAGPAWRQNQLGEDLIHRWARSKNRWQRRAAVVSTVPLNSTARGGNGDSRRTLAVCRLVVNDRDDMVVKALSWALRELSKRDPEGVRQFLAQHEDDLAPRILREVRNKLSTGRKSGKKS
jgi:3-methyladenine DNA glycosylase AlkD